LSHKEHEGHKGFDRKREQIAAKNTLFWFPVAGRRESVFYPCFIRG